MKLLLLLLYVTVANIWLLGKLGAMALLRIKAPAISSTPLVCHQCRITLWPSEADDLGDTSEWAPGNNILRVPIGEVDVCGSNP